MGQGVLGELGRIVGLLGGGRVSAETLPAPVGHASENAGYGSPIGEVVGEDAAAPGLSDTY